MADHPITPKQFLSHSPRRFGRANPERIDNPVWDWMARTGFDPYRARKTLGLEPDFDSPNKPEWCLDRLGVRPVEMPDGRRITIGGEHEDHYDPDFCIYNDVVVQRGDAIEIYAYPKEVFPPTDFHTATLVGDRIIVIGSLGYMEDRRPGVTPVYAFNIRDYSITPLPTIGTNPGWIFKHTAELLDDGKTIEISAGQTFHSDTNDQEDAQFRRNLDDYRFDTSTGVWSKITDRSGWRQFALPCMADLTKPDCSTMRWFTGDILATLGYPLQRAPVPSLDLDEILNDDDELRITEQPDRFHTLEVDGVQVRITDTFDRIELIVEGFLTEQTLERLLDDIRDLARTTHERVGVFHEV